MSIKNTENKLTNIKVAKTLVQKYSVKKEFGQNFLISTKSLYHMVNSAEIESTDSVIEIGPGFGSVTEELLNRGVKPICFEIDPKKIEFLSEYFGEQIELVHQDFLELDFEKFLEDHQIIKYKVVSSLPYNVSKPIVAKLLKTKTQPTIMSVIMQKEVGRDYISTSPDAQFLGAFARVWSNVKSFGKINTWEFYPKPQVDGIIIRFTTPNDIGLTHEEKLKFSDFVHLAFMNPRKQLQSVLKKVYPTIKDIVIALGYKETIRAHELNVDDLLKIYQML